MSISEVLAMVQQNLKAPKGQMNKFGNYRYRSCEDIVEAVKPLLKESGTVLILTDTIECIGDRHYIKATATLELGEASVKSSAYAREPLAKKGMDESQITGAASSYARKYALNGLFAIDDTKDADAHKPDDAPTHKFKSGEKEAIITQVSTCLENGDEHGLKEILSEYKDPEEKMKVWALFNSQQRAAIKALTQESAA